MAERRDRLPAVALGFALAAALSSWNPLSAPFALVVGVAALVLALTAGVGRELRGAPIVPAPARDEVKTELDSAGERTRPARERARAELDALGGSKGAGAGDRRAPPAPKP